VKALYKTALLLAAAALLLGLGVATTFWSFNQIEKAAQVRQHAALVLSEANDFLSALKDAETGQRGYVVTGDEAFLEPYLAVRESIGGRLKALRQLAEISAAQEHLDAITPLLNVKMVDLAHSIELRRNNNLPAAVAGVSSGQGKRLMDAIRAEISSFRQIQESTLAQREAAFQSDLRQLFAIIVGASLLVLLLALWFGYLIYRQTQQRIKNKVHLETQHLLEMQEETNRQLQQTNVNLQASQEEVRASEARYHSVVSALSEGVVLHASDGLITAWNPAAERILGLSTEEMQGRTTRDPRWLNIHEDGSVFPNETLPSQQVLRTGTAQLNVIMGINRPDGALTWVSVNAMPIFDHGDLSPSSVVVSILDITARKAAEAELEQHRQHLEQLVASRTSELSAALTDSTAARHSLQEEIRERQRTEKQLRLSQITLNQAEQMVALGAWTMELLDLENLDRNPCTWSTEMYRLLDYTPQDVPLPNCDAYLARVHPDDHQRVMDMPMQALAEKRPWRTELRLVMADGSERLVLQTGAFSLDEAGNPWMMHGAVLDITAQRRVEDQLRNSQAHLQQALTGADAGSFEWDVETGDIIWSKEAWVLHGLDPQGGHALCDLAPAGQSR
jgi:PAS domain S-box-containing protein